MFWILVFTAGVCVSATALDWTIATVQYAWSFVLMLTLVSSMWGLACAVMDEVNFDSVQAKAELDSVLESLATARTMYADKLYAAQSETDRWRRAYDMVLGKSTPAPTNGAPATGTVFAPIVVPPPVVAPVTP